YQWYLEVPGELGKVQARKWGIVMCTRFFFDLLVVFLLCRFSRHKCSWVASAQSPRLAVDKEDHPALCRALLGGLLRVVWSTQVDQADRVVLVAPLPVAMPSVGTGNDIVKFAFLCRFHGGEKLLCERGKAGLHPALLEKPCGGARSMSSTWKVRND